MADERPVAPALQFRRRRRSSHAAHLAPASKTAALLRSRSLFARRGTRAPAPRAFGRGCAPWSIFWLMHAELCGAYALILAAYRPLCTALTPDDAADNGVATQD